MLTTVKRRVGSPHELYQARGGFYSMMKHSGEDEELIQVLEPQEVPSSLLG